MLSPIPFNSNRIPLAILAVFGLILTTACASKPAATAPKRVYSFWPAAPDEPRVQFLTAFNSSADLEKSQSRFDEMLYGKSSVMPFGKPYGVAMWQGKIYLCDVRSQGVTVLDLRKRVTRVVGLGAAGATGIGKPVDIAIASDGFKYVVDATHRNIGVLDADDKLDNAIVLKDLNPVSVAVYGNEVFVADFTGQCVKVLDRATGKYLRKIGEPGPEDGQFVRPLTVRVDPEGNVVVVDVLKCRVQKFSREGKFIMAFSQMGNLAGDLARPKQFAFDKNGFMYIADAGFSNVQVFDNEGKIVDYFGSVGTHPGAMDLPAGVFVDEDADDVSLFQGYVHPAFQAERLILVANQFGEQRVAVYAQGQLKPGKGLADIMASRGKVASGTTKPSTEPSNDASFTPGNESAIPAAPPVIIPTTRPIGP